MSYAHRYTDENIYKVIHYFTGGERELPPNQHDYLEWVVSGGVPDIEAAGRFLSVVDGVLVVDANKVATLAAEEVARVAEQERIAAKTKSIADNLPSWQQISDAIDAATTIAALKGIVKKLARVVYWDVKNSQE